MASLLASLAHAQEIDAHGFVLAAFDADPRDPLTVQRPGSFETDSGFVGAVFEYAKQPVVGVAPGREPSAFVDNLFALDLSAGYAPHERVRFDATVPAYGFTGTGLDARGQAGLGIGDSRLTAMVALLRPAAGQGFGLALVPHVDLPTGQFHAFLGRGRVAGGGGLAATLERGSLTVSADLGVQLETTQDIGANLTNPDAFTGGLAAGVLLDDELGLTAEIHGAVPFQGPAPGWTDAPFEVLGALRYAGDSGAHFLAGGGAGVTQGTGAAGFRVFVGGGFGARGGPRDRDGDGLDDEVDRCPAEPEVMNGFQDDDGCPDVRPKLSAWASYDGVLAEGAALRIEGPVTREMTVGTTPFTMEVDPGSVWKGTATWGPCLKGERIVTAAGTSLDLDVPLGLMSYGVAWVRVVDAGGQAAAGAQVTVTPATPNCAPRDTFTTDARGEARVEVGPGTHTVTVRSGGLKGTGSLRAEEGREIEVFVVLVPAP